MINLLFNENYHLQLKTTRGAITYLHYLMTIFQKVSEVSREWRPAEVTAKNAKNKGQRTIIRK